MLTRQVALAALLLVVGTTAFAPGPSAVRYRQARALRVKTDDSEVKAVAEKDKEDAAISLPPEPSSTPVSGGGSTTLKRSTKPDQKDVWVKLELDRSDAVAFAGRALDTIEDAATHFRRAWEPAALDALNIKFMQKKVGAKPRVVVLGSGWGGHAVTKIIDHEVYDVVVISPRNCFVFTPMLAASAVGTVDPSSITESVQEANPQVTYIQGAVRSIDTEAKLLTVEVYAALTDEADGDGAVTELVELDYSKLVYSVGSKTGTFGVPGVRENCYFLKEVSDAQRLRRALLRRFDEASFPGMDDEERRRLLAFVVIGSGPTGIEFSGELGDLLKSDVPRLFPSLVKFTSLKVISSANTILPMFEKVLQEKGLEEMSKGGVDVILGQRVTAVKRGAAVLQDGREIPFGLCFWAGGTEPRKLTTDLVSSIPTQSALEGAARGQLTVDGHLRVKGVKDGSVLGIGDAVRVEGQRLPTTGQVAAQQGAYVARLINRGYVLNADGPPLAPSQAVEKGGDKNIVAAAGDYLRLRGDLKARPFHFINLGVLAYIGSGSGLAQVSGGEKTRLLDASGKIGFFLWRSTYIVKQVSVRNRVCVLIDWFKSKTFGRAFTSPAEYFKDDE